MEAIENNNFIFEVVPHRLFLLQFNTYIFFCFLLMCYNMIVFYVSTFLITLRIELTQLHILILCDWTVNILTFTPT